MKKPRILIVEDEAIVARDIHQQLVELGYEPVAEARRGEDALTLAERLRPDLVLMDVHLAGAMDGIEAAQAIRGQFAIPVVFLTAFAGNETLNRAKITEPFGYIIKPFDARELHTVIEMALYKHKSETRLHQSYEEQDAILRSALDGFWAMDLQGRILDVNDAVCRMNGYTREELLQMSITDLELDESPAEIAVTTERIKQTGAAQFERRHRGKDGRIIHIEVSIAFLPQSGGRIYAFMRDITERKQIEETQLFLLQCGSKEAGEEFFASLARYLAETLRMDYVCIDRLQGEGLMAQTIAVYNEGKFEDNVQYALKDTPCGEVAGKTVCCFPEGVRHKFPKDLALQELQAESYVGATMWSCDGRPIGLIAVIGQVPLKNTRLAEAILKLVAIRAAGELERTQADEALRESGERFHNLLQTVPYVAVQSYGADGTVLYWNKASERLYGYTAQEAVGRNLLELIIPPEMQEEVKAAVQQMIETGVAIPSAELTLVCKDGSRVSVLSSHAIVHIPGRPSELFCIDIDITARKKLEAHSLRTQRMESIGTLAAGIAHDLNNILAPIILSANLLREMGQSDSLECLVSTIEESARRGASVVNQVLTFARGVPGERAALQLRHLFHEMEKIMRETFPKNIAITNHTPPDLWPVKGDPTQMHQVLLNLCINARDAMPDGGTLLISGKNEEIDESYAAMAPDAKPGRYAMFAISDSGTGISREILGKIFDPFFTTKEVGKGTGLGLSTVAGILRSHGGFITVESDEGMGTTFKVFLPADTEEAVEQHPAPKHAPPAPGCGEMILVVDDEESIAKVTATVLKRNGYKVFTATDGADALSLYMKHMRDIQVVLTDVMMPDMDGVNLARALKKLNPQVKIITSTGQATETRQAELRKLGVNVILHKPYAADKLLAALHKALHPENTEA